MALLNVPPNILFEKFSIEEIQVVEKNTRWFYLLFIKTKPSYLPLN